MLSYRHSYHAGNFADVFKHGVLIQLIRSLLKKDKPFFVLDTHAGAGRYDLRTAEAQKLGEYHAGIGRLWERRDLGPELNDYLGQVGLINHGSKLVVYPGSPTITRQLLREDDRLVLCEMHSTDHAWLQSEFADARHVSVLHTDGYAALKGQIPPRENRGLIFMDPSFEMGGEFERLLDAVKLVQARWRNGMMALWYPILHRAPSARFHQQLQRLEIPGVLCAEIGLQAYDSPQGMHGCGMVVINPPWKLDEMLKRVLPELLGIFDPGPQGQWRVEWLTAGG